MKKDKNSIKVLFYLALEKEKNLPIRPQFSPNAVVVVPKVADTILASSPLSRSSLATEYVHLESKTAIEESSNLSSFWKEILRA
jgi:hypothetical protein